MTKLLSSNLRGLSEIVSYVLLVVIAVGISVAVYAFISVYIPKDKPTCPTDVFIGTSKIECTVGGQMAGCYQVGSNAPACDQILPGQTQTYCAQYGCSYESSDASCTGEGHKPCTLLSSSLCNNAPQRACEWKPATTGDGAQVTLGLVNKGLFTIDAAYIRVAQEGRDVTFLINEPKEAGSARGFYLYEPGSLKPGLTPGKEVLYSYDVPSSIISAKGKYTLEIQPAIGRGNNLALCEAGISRQTITCA